VGHLKWVLMAVLLAGCDGGLEAFFAEAQDTADKDAKAKNAIVCSQTVGAHYRSTPLEQLAVRLLCGGVNTNDLILTAPDAG